jgi:ribonuclease P protein component
VRARAEYKRVFEGGRRFASPQLTLHWLRDAQPPRLGLAVSRKVDPDAVGRNRIKRCLRDQFRRIRPALDAGAYVLVARPSAAQATNHALRAALLALLQRAGALPPTDAPGTMPASDCDRPSPNPMPRVRAG